MRNTRFALLAAGFLLIPLSAFAQNYDPPPPPQMQPGPMRMSHHRLKLSPEQRLMLTDSIKQQTRGMAKDQRKAAAHQEMAKFKAMNANDQQNYIQGLQAKWDAMPAGRKQQLEQKQQQKMARRAARRGQVPPPGQ